MYTTRHYHRSECILEGTHRSECTLEGYITVQNVHWKALSAFRMYTRRHYYRSEYTLEGISYPRHKVPSGM
jgi:hypothetical protein